MIPMTAAMPVFRRALAHARRTARALWLGLSVSIALALCVLSCFAQHGPPTARTGNGAAHPAASSALKSGPEATQAPSATMQLRMDARGTFVYRFLVESRSLTAPAPLPEPSGADHLVVVAVPAAVSREKGALLELLAVDNGNAARLPVSVSGITPVADAAFRYVQRVVVPVQSNGKGLVGAAVSLTSADKKYKSTTILNGSDAGVARFEYAPLDVPMTVTVSFGAHPPTSVIDTFTADHPSDAYHVQTIAVDWPDAKTVALPAVAAPAPGAATGAGSPAPAPTGSAASNLAGTVIALAVVAGLGYLLYLAVVTGRAKPFLAKLGIEFQPAPPAGPPISPFAKPEKAPITPITEGTADPLLGASAAAVAPAVAGSGPRLVATMGTYSGSVFPVNGNLEIGRDPSNGVALSQDTSASRRHATIRAAGGEFSVVDNGSSNGTFLNGVRIDSGVPQALRPGDEVQIGMTRFRFEA